MASEDLRIRFDVSRFNKALLVYSEKSKRSNEDILKQQARLIVKEVISITPPGKEGIAGLAAKKKGEASVKGDIKRLFSPVKKARAEETDLAGIHKQNRNRKGRVSKRVGKHKVYSADLNKYLRQQTAKVGSLAAGWNAAAVKLGYNPPAWIKRHDSPSSADIKLTDSKITVVMTNRVRYAGEQKGLERRIQRAMKRKENDLIRQVNKSMGENSPFKRG